MSALHRFFYEDPLVAARCTRCGKLVAVYWGHDAGCSDCDGDEGWRSTGKCRCNPPLPARSQMAAQIAKAYAAKRKRPKRKPLRHAATTIYV
ncbi:hypothetical protein [Mycobacterium lehmannii]|uniref:hypothetical protein n=1 Tax=Mycobacterium lehmannii TaxID=2048550 RepID=UPI000B9427D3|nr:hypothetical protein [Mycobacterium lehmannii]